MTTRENDQPVRVAPTESTEGTTTVDASPAPSPAEVAPAAPPAPSSVDTTLENPNAAPAAPTESTEGTTTVEASPAPASAPSSAKPRERVEIAADDVGDVGAVLGTLENPNAAPVAPTESTEGTTTVEASPAPSSAKAAAPAAAALEPPRAVRMLPRRPRLRASFSYGEQDALSMELTLMDEQRNLIHRMQTPLDPGGVLARIFEVLIGVVANAAAEAGVFGKRPAAAAEAKRDDG